MNPVDELVEYLQIKDKIVTCLKLNSIIQFTMSSMPTMDVQYLQRRRKSNYEFPQRNRWKMWKQSDNDEKRVNPIPVSKRVTEFGGGGRRTAGRRRRRDKLLRHHFHIPITHPNPTVSLCHVQSWTASKIPTVNAKKKQNFYLYIYWNGIVIYNRIHLFLFLQSLLLLFISLSRSRKNENGFIAVKYSYFGVKRRANLIKVEFENSNSWIIRYQTVSLTAFRQASTRSCLR